MIIIKRVERIKLNNAEDDSNDTMTTQVEENRYVWEMLLYFKSSQWYIKLI